jgi:hypothetical protein
VKRLTLTLTDDAAAILQERVPYHEKGAYVSRLIEADAGISAEVSEGAEVDVIALQQQVGDLVRRVAELEARVTQQG